MSDNPSTKTDCTEIVARCLPALTDLCRQFGVRRLDLFGSATTGRFDPTGSDLDFLVEFEEPPQGGFTGPYFRLLEALEALFGRKVDLLTRIENPYRRRRIEAEKVTLYRAPR